MSAALFRKSEIFVSRVVIKKGWFPWYGLTRFVLPLIFFQVFSKILVSDSIHPSDFCKADLLFSAHLEDRAFCDFKNLGDLFRGIDLHTYILVSFHH